MSKFIIMLSFLLFGCTKNQQTNQKIVDINPNNAKSSIHLSKIVDSISYIKLETNPESLLGRVGVVIVKEKYIYALDYLKKAIVVFDKTGRYISKLNKFGNGPDQYRSLMPGHFIISDDEDYIEVIENLGESSRILKYSNISFELIEEQKAIIPNANSWRKNGNTYYFSAQQNNNIINEKKVNSDIIIVKDAKIQKSLFNKKINTNGSGYTYNSESFTQNNENEIFVSLMFNNTFYQLQEMNALPILSIDFGKFKIDHSIGEKNTIEQQKYLQKNTNGRAFFPVLNANNSSVMAFSYYFKTNNKINLNQYIHFKKKNTVFHTKRILNDISQFPKEIKLCSYSTANHEIIYNKYFLLDIVFPEETLTSKEEKIEGVGLIKRSDNPIIMIMKIKDEHI